jgi:hypothetical protein
MFSVTPRPRLAAGIAAAVLALAVPMAAQFPHLPRLPLPSGSIDELATERLLRREPPISTDLSDAVTQAPFLDDYNPPEPLPLAALGYDANGVYHVFGGDFAVTLQTYCLHAGAYAPSSGDGYAYADLHGPESTIVRHVLQRSVRARDIPQTTIQMLVWTILSRTRPNTLNGELRQAAERLLDKQELSSLNGGALGVIPDDLRMRITPRLPEAVQRTIEIDNRIRSLAAQSGLTFEDWKAIAVPAGRAIARGGAPALPSGRWSYHKDGYFIRFKPSSFLETRVEVSVPRAIRIVRDAKGRITEIADRLRELTVSYDDSRPATMVYRNAELATKPGQPIATWTLAVRSPGPAPPRATSAKVSDDFARAVSAARDVAALRDAVRSQPKAAARSAWPNDVDAFLAQAWETAVAQQMGRTASGADPPFDPAGIVAVPGSESQRLGLSPRPSPDHDPKCEGTDSSGTGWADDVAAGMSSNGDHSDLTNVTLANKGGIVTISERLDDKMCPLPSADCLNQMIGSGGVAPGSLAGAHYLVSGAVQQANGTTRVTLRIVDVATGEIVATGLGDATGTGDAAVRQATDQAMKQLKSHGATFCGG